MLKFKDIVKEQSIMILLAFINNTLPSPVSRMFKYERTTNTRQAKHFAIPVAFRNYRLFALSCNAPRIWNVVIASKIKDLDAVPRKKVAVKRQVRKYFLEEYIKISKGT